MKNLIQNQENKNNRNQQTAVSPSLQISVYNEMSDQTSQQVDVIQMIQKQFSELNQLSAKRIFLLKDISNYLK